MRMRIDTAHLNAQGIKAIDKILKEYNVNDFDAYIRIWNKSEIQIDGSLSLKEIETLALCMKALKNDNKK